MRSRAILMLAAAALTCAPPPAAAHGGGAASRAARAADEATAAAHERALQQVLDFAQLAAEARAGLRPPGTLAPWLPPNGLRAVLDQPPAFAGCRAVPGAISVADSATALHTDGFATTVARQRGARVGEAQVVLARVGCAGAERASYRFRFHVGESGAVSGVVVTDYAVRPDAVPVVSRLQP